MLVPLCETPLLEAERHIAADLTERVTQGDLPAFALHNAGATLEEAIEPVLGPLIANGFCHFSPPITLTKSGSRAEAWHLDPQTQKVMTGVDAINLHFTAIGQTQANFVEPTDALEPLTRQEGWHHFFHTRLLSPLQQGQVDPHLLIPRVLTATAEPGTLIVFRSQGRRPLAHFFESLSSRRESHLYIASKEKLFVKGSTRSR